jgi:hypothetical protein
MAAGRCAGTGRGGQHVRAVARPLEPASVRRSAFTVALPPDPDPYPAWHSTQAEQGGQNYSGFDNRDADEAIEVARQLNDPAERVPLYYRFQEIFAEEVPAILLYQAVYTYGTDKRVRNIQIAPMSDPSGRFRGVSQWAILEREVALSELNDQIGDQLDSHTDPWYDSARGRAEVAE